MHRYVIIGLGAAGFAAAQAIRRVEPKADILPICEEPFGYYSRPGLAYYLTGELVEKQIFPYNETELQRMNIRPLNGRVVRIHPVEKLVELRNGTAVPYDKLLIATGASAAEVKVPGTDLTGVVKLDCLVDARLIIRFARKVRAAVIIGGGITAIEIVEGLRARGVKTHYFLRRDRYWGNVLDETESRIIEKRLKQEGVLIHYQTELQEIVGKQGRVVAVRTQDGREITCGLVAIAAGIKPRKEIAETAGLTIDRGILVDDYLGSSHADIYAAGDVAQVFDPITGKSVLDSLWGPAREQGHAAGLNMTGKRVQYIKPVAFNVTRLAGLTTTIIGGVGKGRDEDLLTIARGDSETWRQLGDAIAAQNGFEVNRLRVLVGEQNLLGAVLMGDQMLSRPLQYIIARKADITCIRHSLLQPNAPIGDILCDYWIHWNQRNAA